MIIIIVLETYLLTPIIIGKYISYKIETFISIKRLLSIVKIILKQIFYYFNNIFENFNSVSSGVNIDV